MNFDHGFLPCLPIKALLLLTKPRSFHEVSLGCQINLDVNMHNHDAYCILLTPDEAQEYAINADLLMLHSLTFEPRSCPIIVSL